MAVSILQVNAYNTTRPSWSILVYFLYFYIVFLYAQNAQNVHLEKILSAS